MPEGISESLPSGPSEDFNSAENQAKVNEKVAAFKARASGSDPIAKHMKKREHKARKKDDSLAEFLIHCIHSSHLDESLLAALNNALKNNHSPHFLIEGLLLVYNIDNLKQGISQQLCLHDSDNIESIENWLKKLESAAYENPQSTLKNIQKHPQSLSLFFEKVLYTYIKTYQSLNPQHQSLDLVEMSTNITTALEQLLKKYVSSHSLE